MKKYNVKKSYRQPEIKEIGKAKEVTKGGSGNLDFDFSFPFNPQS